MNQQQTQQINGIPRPGGGHQRRYTGSKIGSSNDRSTAIMASLHAVRAQNKTSPRNSFRQEFNQTNMQHAMGLANYVPSQQQINEVSAQIPLQMPDQSYNRIANSAVGSIDQQLQMPSSIFQQQAMNLDPIQQQILQLNPPVLNPVQQAQNSLNELLQNNLRAGVNQQRAINSFRQQNEFRSIVQPDNTNILGLGADTINHLSIPRTKNRTDSESFMNTNQIATPDQRSSANQSPFSHQRNINQMVTDHRLYETFHSNSKATPQDNTRQNLSPSRPLNLQNTFENSQYFNFNNTGRGMSSNRINEINMSSYRDAINEETFLSNSNEILIFEHAICEFQIQGQDSISKQDRILLNRIKKQGQYSTYQALSNDYDYNPLPTLSQQQDKLVCPGPKQRQRGLSMTMQTSGSNSCAFTLACTKDSGCQTIEQQEKVKTKFSQGVQTSTSTTTDGSITLSINEALTNMANKFNVKTLKKHLHTQTITSSFDTISTTDSNCQTVSTVTSSFQTQTDQLQTKQCHTQVEINHKNIRTQTSQLSQSNTAVQASANSVDTDTQTLSLKEQTKVQVTQTQIIQSRSGTTQTDNQEPTKQTVGIQYEDQTLLIRNKKKSQTNDLSDCDDLDVGDNYGQTTGINQLYQMNLFDDDLANDQGNQDLEAEQINTINFNSHIRQKSTHSISHRQIFETPRMTNDPQMQTITSKFSQQGRNNTKQLFTNNNTNRSQSINNYRNNDARHDTEIQQKQVDHKGRQLFTKSFVHVNRLKNIQNSPRKQEIGPILSAIQPKNMTMVRQIKKQKSLPNVNILTSNKNSQVPVILHNHSAQVKLTLNDCDRQSNQSPDSGVRFNQNDDRSSERNNSLYGSNKKKALVYNTERRKLVRPRGEVTNSNFTLNNPRSGQKDVNASPRQKLVKSKAKSSPQVKQKKLAKKDVSPTKKQDQTIVNSKFR